MISPSNAQDHQPTLIANLARLRQASSPASKFPACDFSAPEGVATYLSVLADYGLLNRLNAARWFPDRGCGRGNGKPAGS
jgi:hypothetical protein